MKRNVIRNYNLSEEEKNEKLSLSQDESEKLSHVCLADMSERKSKSQWKKR